MTVEHLPATSTEYLRVPLEGGSASIPAEIAVISTCGEPVEADWHAAVWDTVLARYKILVGPGTPLQFTPGMHAVWIRFTASPEEVVRRSGPLRVGP